MFVEQLSTFLIDRTSFVRLETHSIKCSGAFLMHSSRPVTKGFRNDAVFCCFRSVIAEGSRRVSWMVTLSVFILTLFDRSIEKRGHSMQQADQFSWRFIFACEQNEK